MRIGEIAESTGLSVSNIRFYEKKGLIGPDREKESKYRNYTEEDLRRLNLIVLYRKMDLSVETIGRILTKEISAEDALEQQLLDLKAKQEELQGSIDLCQKMIEDQAYGDSETLEIDTYLNYVKEEEAKGRRFAKLDDLLDDYSEFTRMQYFAGTSLFMLFPHLWMNRLIMIVWCGIFMLFPIAGIIGELCEEDPSIVAILFFIVWAIVFNVSFFVFRKRRQGGR